MWLIDFETCAMVPISDPLYTSHAETKIICMSLTERGSGDVHLWWGALPHLGVEASDMNELEPLFAHIKAGGLVGASNAAFDSAIWNNIGTRDYGFPPVPIEQWYCTQAQSRVAGIPSSLDNSARATGTKFQKDRMGSELIKRCCIPPFSTDVNDYLALGQYCIRDTQTMDEVSLALPDLSDQNLRDYHVNERINQRGIRIDHELAKSATFYAEAEREEIAAELFHVTCGAVEKPTQHQRFKKWLVEVLEDDHVTEALALMVKYDKGKKKMSADKTVRANLIAGHETGDFALAPDVLEALTLMDDAGGSATAKFGKMVRSAHPADQRVRGVLRYAGAQSTQRYSSQALQVHNLRRDAFSVDEALHYRALMLKGEPLIDMSGEPVRVMDTLGRLLRSAIIPAEGHVFVVADWSSIESRMTAALAGDEDKLDIFRSGGDVYCHAASAIYGRTIDPEIDKAERQIGKVTELACGFLGGPGALLSMAKQYRIPIPEEKAQGIVEAFRAASPKLVKLGDTLHKAATRAVQRPDVPIKAGPVTYEFCSYDGALYCDLPDGQTALRYPEARLEKRPAPWDPDQEVIALTALKAAFTAKADAKEWPRHSLWRGLLVENCIAENTLVATDRGWVKIQNIRASDLIFDGVEFVKHDGLAWRGVQNTVKLWGVELTPDHEVLTNEGWFCARDITEAQCERFNRAAVSLPESLKAHEKARRSENPLLALSMRLWDRAYSSAKRPTERLGEVMRMPAGGTTDRDLMQPWYVEASGILGMAEHARPLPSSFTSGVEKLRRPRHKSLRVMGRKFRKLLGRYGRQLSRRLDPRAHGQQQRLFESELCLGGSYNTSEQSKAQCVRDNTVGLPDGGRSFKALGYTENHHTIPSKEWVGGFGRGDSETECKKPVYDILNCGPRTRFVVKGDDGPVIVHNCVQASCAILLRNVISQVSAHVVFHVHDEVILEVPVEDAQTAAGTLQRLMETPPAWMPSLPLVAEPAIMTRYGK